MLEVNYCNLVAVGAVAAEDGLQARRGPALVIYEAACPEIPTSHHTTLILLPHSLQSSNSSNPSNNCVNAPTFVLLCTGCLKKMPFLGKIAITTLKLIQNAKVGGVLENSGFMLPDGH